MAASLLAVLLVATAARAQDERRPPPPPAPGEPQVETRASAQEPMAAELTSGPLAGTPLPAVRVHAPVGPLAGEELDAAARIGDGPGLLLFVHELSRNTAPLIGGLDKLAMRYRALGLVTCTILLSADRNEGESRVRAASGSLRMRHPLVVSTEGAEGPGAYALNRRCTLTIVSAKGGKVVQSVALTDTGRADLPRLEQLIVEVTGPLPEDPARLHEAVLASLPQDEARVRALAADLALDVQHLAAQAEGRGNERRNAPNQRRMQDAGGERGERGEMRRPGGGSDARGEGRGEGRPEARGAARTRRGAPPQDAELQTLLRRAIDKLAGSEQVERTFAAIEQRAAASAELRAETKAMLELMLDLGYGTEAAQKKAQAWLDAQSGSGK